MSTAPPAPGETVIAATGLTRRYKGHTAVDGIDLDIRRGEIFGILGPNGAGKTTTLEMIEGLRTPDAGRIEVAGIDAVRDADRVRQIIGVQLQTTALFPFLSAGELVSLFGSLYGVADPAGQVDRLLALVGLEEKAGARVEEMSGGQQQRLSIALALVNTPEIVFLDEPTTGLDPRARRVLWDTIRDIRARGATVVLTTHYMEEAEILCDRIAIMDSGRIIACDTPEGLIRALPIDATVSATIARAGGAPITEADLRAIPGVATVTIDPDAAPPALAATTSDVQATITGLLRLAEARGVTLGELTSTRASLEDVFLTRTGRTYHEEEAGANGEGDTPEEPKGRRRGRRSG
jgi:ABC-2 type transport system ATP-binding protein